MFRHSVLYYDTARFGRKFGERVFRYILTPFVAKGKRGGGFALLTEVTNGNRFPTLPLDLHPNNFRKNVTCRRYVTAHARRGPRSSVTNSTMPNFATHLACFGYANAFVRTSAGMSSVGRYPTSSSPFSTHSRVK